jgi:RNA 3'-terminal phosphate cyclase (ATP)
MNSTNLIIDGSHGEGGGQILRSSLALSMVTGQPFEIDHIRAGRKKPGLMRQHLTSLRAAQTVSQAEVTGDAIGSRTVTFKPGQVQPGEYQFSIGTAGSTTLVFQTVLPALMLASGPSTIILEGGTHNPFAPPVDFLAKAFLPLLKRMGPKVSVTVERAGFYPAGGGRLKIDIEPVVHLTPLELMERGKEVRREAKATVANLPRDIGEREAKVIARKMNWDSDVVHIEEIRDTPGPGNIAMIELAFEHVCEIFTGFGEIKRSAEAVANHAVQQCRRYLKTGAPVGEYLADQLILPMAICGQGSFRASCLSRHSLTHIDLVRQFLQCKLVTNDLGRDGATVCIGN